MRFTIITPTHKRADKLTRAIESVLGQTYAEWRMIIVNDSPEDISYAPLEQDIADRRITYLKNEENSGVNFSRNRALDIAVRDSDWVIFLDDDDYLTPDALATLHDLILAHPKETWFVTNRAYASGKSATKFPKPDTTYSYAWDYLITKKGEGDATHCINAKIVTNVRFSTRIKQAEEWIFFFQIGLKTHMFYSPHNSTLTDGYDEASGLNFRTRPRKKQLEMLSLIAQEGFNLHLLYHPTFCIYLLLRFVRLSIKG
ncbi:MAG: glycosyltransferase [Candidatus Pacebacteria bacterium]|jgi:glycosyltransferase involved in cell wall biosynthesis|nr:glycosyltransferase [Candidatus Paceibacterota bacterium]